MIARSRSRRHFFRTGIGAILSCVAPAALAATAPARSPADDACYQAAATIPTFKLRLSPYQEHGDPATRSPTQPTSQANAAPADAPAFPQAASEPADESATDRKPVWLRPFSVDITYSLYSDYVWRGLILSDYPGEAPEAVNHQLTTTLDVDLGKLAGRKEDGGLGVFCFETFFEWFPFQHELDPVYGGRELQEVDYTLSYCYDVKPLATTLGTGVVFYRYPMHSEIATEEWFFRVEHNDAWMWKWLWPDNEEGILNPHVQYSQDTRLVAPGSWWQFGFNHDFAATPSLTITPNIEFGVDHNWLPPTLGLDDNGTHFANIQYGLTLAYDVTEVMGFDKWGYGSVTVSGFIFYSQAVGIPAANDWLRDQLYGGMSVGWSF